MMCAAFVAEHDTLWDTAGFSAGFTPRLYSNPLNVLGASGRASKAQGFCGSEHYGQQ